ncbi:MAG TPA: HD domain-containing protein [Candidatus Acetatifactor stercoripullorum]|uniref:HD domain-containing protein n=1 Tax=Candidatus Acetatifactor stercoripullorum TaxID=2838414 RepID=A0A9D1UBJ7_9FIRM|nr:HD domain-containing protein [uncultured Acetatifactor sp.]HIW81238.1 HD domain-containing protein [Candidatus Acetatifactor stercoripullorum]
MQIDRERAKSAFWAYVNGFDVQKDMIRLKVEHTFRVSQLCEEIADSLGLSKEDRDLAWLIGLLHDLGRFEQQRRYGTFNDALSIDHARYGAELLFGEAESAVSIRDFVEEDSEDGLIRTAVFYHSAYRIPENLDHRTAMFCNILRDADKIDILKVNVEFPLEEIYNVSTEVLYGEQVSPQVMESFFEGHAVLRSLKKTAVDHVVGHISLVFELVYPKSIEIVKKQGYLEKLLHFPSKNPVTRQQFAQIREKMK